MTIALTGELGAGKTTFLQGFASALGIERNLTSPTYALEQRYVMAHQVGVGSLSRALPRGERPLPTEFLHLDLYRLSPKQSEELLHGSGHFQGIRCIEWSERIDLERLIKSGHVIHVHITEGATADERTIECAFHDAALLGGGQIAQWRKDVLLPPHIAAHCDTVAHVAGTLADILVGRGQIVRKHLLQDAARAHDLLRFLDFSTGGASQYPGHSDGQVALWKVWKLRYAGKRHEEACAAFLVENGYPDIAAVVAVHGLTLPAPERSTIEQKLLFYADKRVMVDTVTSLDGRFADFAKRYGNGTMSDEGKIWYAEAKRLEEELFPEGSPV